MSKRRKIESTITREPPPEEYPTSLDLYLECVRQNGALNIAETYRRDDGTIKALSQSDFYELLEEAQFGASQKL